MASITEVARLAGVSTATASRVVSSADYAVSAATRARVLDAARALDYVPNALARGLHKSHVPVVGVIVHDITDPYFAEVVRGVEDAASAAGFLVITCSSDRDAERESSYVRLLRSMRAAAVIFAGSGLDDPELNEEVPKHLAAMRVDGAAVVHLSPHALGEADIGVDNAAGMASMVAALVELGHREIAFLAGPSSLYVSRARLAGYRRGLAEAGIAYDERVVIATSFDPDGGALGVDTLLSGDAPFTAICCANDLLALGALQRLAALGIDVPGEVSVAGFDDIPTAAMHAPSLSTVRLPLREIGRRGFVDAERMLGGDELARAGAADRAGDARLDGCAAAGAPLARGSRGPSRGRRRVTRVARRPGRPRHRQQPRHRRRGRGQGRRRRRDRRGPLPPVGGCRPTDPRTRPRGRGGGRLLRRRHRRRRPGRAAGRAGHRAVRARRRPGQQRRADPGRAVPRDRPGASGTRSSGPT